ncbi:hypothetical protein GGQ68_000405 [Sagittula marina]|uniref:Uncharacterized protein n=1 Tax=Sagittula marina TaxID=943940 RepID=A0A7W6GSG2_9RHOB|nr:hypothetical protein [Sagittula marina]
MFRLIRLPILLVIAFAVGVFYERGQQQALCDTSGGQWMRSGFCSVK